PAELGGPLDRIKPGFKVPEAFKALRTGSEPGKERCPQGLILLDAVLFDAPTHPLSPGGVDLHEGAEDCDADRECFLKIAAAHGLDVVLLPGLFVSFQF